MKIRPALLRIFLRRIPLIKLRVVLSGTNRIRIPLRSNQFFTRWNDCKCNWRYFAFISIWLAARLNSETSLFSPFHWIKKYFVSIWNEDESSKPELSSNIPSWKQRMELPYQPFSYNCSRKDSPRGKRISKRNWIYVYIDMRKTESFAEETLNK